MGWISNNKKTTSRTTRVVVTGKRVKGTWMMESKLTPQRRTRRHAQNALPAENRRVRTLH